ncbi:MAG TPA: DUF3325 family protein [Burkholderiales bacterium]|jgi:hypothetical protein|nr:DUF3325 family protein [Burkholderiales bacterium]
MILFLAVATGFLGLAWLALAMDVHWLQVTGTQSRRPAIALRFLGAAALAASLVLCFIADHVSMAPLVWVMAIAGGALLVAFTMAWKPRLLRPLIPRIRARD